MVHSRLCNSAASCDLIACVSDHLLSVEQAVGEHLSGADGDTHGEVSWVQRVQLRHCSERAKKKKAQQRKTNSIAVMHVDTACTTDGIKEMHVDNSQQDNKVSGGSVMSLFLDLPLFSSIFLLQRHLELLCR
jgi:hypothetical protein